MLAFLLDKQISYVVAEQLHTKRPDIHIESVLRWREGDLRAKSDALVLELAAILIAHEDTMQPFFSDAARHLLFGVMEALNHLLPGEWTLRMVCLAMRSVETLRQLLSRSPESVHLARLYLKEGTKVQDSILSTIATKMMPLEVVAALWDKAAKEGRSFSLREWTAQEQILVLGSHEIAREALDTINRAIFKRLSELLLSQNPQTGRRTFLVLDELREVSGRQPLDGLHSLLLRGRSYGVCCVLASQSKSGLNAVYSEYVADELADQTGFKVFLKSDGETAIWAAKQFGEQESIELRSSQSYNYGGENTTVSQGISEEYRRTQTVMAGEIMSLPSASGSNGLEAFVKTPFGAYRTHCNFAPLLCPEDINTPAFVARPEEDQRLEDWTDIELETLGLVRVPETAEEINWREIRQRLFPKDKRKRGSPQESSDEA